MARLVWLVTGPCTKQGTHSPCSPQHRNQVIQPQSRAISHKLASGLQFPPKLFTRPHCLYCLLHVMFVVLPSRGCRLWAAMHTVALNHHLASLQQPAIPPHYELCFRIHICSEHCSHTHECNLCCSFISAVGEQSQIGLHICACHRRSTNRVYNATMLITGILLALDVCIQGIHGSCSRAAVPLCDQ